MWTAVIGPPYTPSVQMRDDFPESVKRAIAARVGNRCSNPGCRAPTSGPKDDPTGAINVGVAAHITAAAPGGPRYDGSLSPEQRKHPSNAIWLCQTCADLVDEDSDCFTVELLQTWKKRAEDAALREIGKNVIPPRGFPVLQIDVPEALARWPLSHLLRPHNCFVPLIGRERELESLASFCEAPNPFRWLVVAGDGGVGKTRLAIELAKSHAEKGWIAGFLSAEAMAGWIRHTDFARWSPEVDTLIVVEYAAAKLEGLKSVLWRCGCWANSSPTYGKIRLILLERRGDLKEGWIRELVDSAEGGLRGQLLGAMEPVLNLGPAGGTGREQAVRAILGATFEGWARLPGDDPKPACPELDSSQIEELVKNTGALPLFIEMAALRACAANDTSRLAKWGQGELIADMVERARIYIRKYCSGGTAAAELVERAIALVTLTGPINIGSQIWRQIVGSDARRCGYPETRAGEAGNAAASLLVTQRRLGRTVVMPSSPDLLGEAFMINVLGERPDCVIESIEEILDGGVEAIWNTWNALLRTAIDLHSWSQFVVVRAWIVLLVNRRPVRERRLIESLIPAQSVALSGIARVLVERHLAELAPPPADKLERAGLLDRLGRLYVALGKPEEALAASSQSLEIFRGLATGDQVDAKFALAASLDTCSLVHAALGRREDAVKAAEEAVQICERLIEQKIEHVRPLLAKVLVGLGASYGELRQHEKSLTATRHAVEIYEELARRLPSVFEVPLAASFDNVSIAYLSVGKPQEALAAASRAADIFQVYAERNPDAFDPDLVRSLINLSNCYTGVGRAEEALSAAIRAGSISGNLDKLVPGLFAPLHALSLQNMAVSYAEVGNLENARDAGRRAANIYENLARENPALYIPPMEKALGHLALIYGKLKRMQEVLATAQRAVNFYEELARGDWENHWQKLARSLDGMAACCRVCGRKEDELRTTQRLAEVYQRSGAGATVEKQLAATFGSLGHLELEQNPRKAIAWFRRGIETLRDSFMAEPTRFAALMDGLMKDYFDTCDSVGDEPDWALTNPIASVRVRSITG